MEKLTKNKRINGITLIALVITIIVLLILAGISISMLSGDNSILKRAGDARDKAGTKGLSEETQMVLMGRRINTSTGLENKTLKEDLESGISGAEVEEIKGPDGTNKYTDVYYVKKGNDYVTVYEDGDVEEGKVEIWDGEKISCPKIKKENNKWNWYIYTPAQLKFLADFVNNGDGSTLPESLTSYVTEAGYKTEDVTMSTDTTIYLMNNLDLGARQKDGTKTIGKDWTPIGTDFNNVEGKFGTFEGNNHVIKGVYVKRQAGRNGIFGCSNTIQNLTIKDSYIEGGMWTASVVGSALSGEIENCHNENTIILGDANVGGVVGYADINVKKCTNTGIVTGNSQVGGVVGNINNKTSIIKCKNESKVNGMKNNIGGIVGFTHQLNTIERCINNGNIIGNGVCIGGIVGGNAGIISNCINNAKIKGLNNCIGGIAGSNGNTINKCLNNGTITGRDESIGGIAGIVVDGFINNNYNKGIVLIESDEVTCIGGIVGKINKGTIKYNYNIGKFKVIGKNVNKIGELIGEINTTTTRDHNYYLQGKSNVTFDSTEGETKTSEEMKTQEFLNKLNEGQTPAVWEFREGENNGYPVLIKTEE